MELESKPDQKDIVGTLLERVEDLNHTCGRVYEMAKTLERILYSEGAKQTDGSITHTHKQISEMRNLITSISEEVG